MYPVHDWAEVHRLRREGLSKTVISERLGMSRTTVRRLASMSTPPRYERSTSASLLDPFKGEIASMLDQDAKVATTVVIERLRRGGYAGGITILKDHLAKVRPAFLAAKTYQRTSYLPGEISQIDWWHTGARIPIGKGATKEAFGLVATLPASAAHAAVFTLSRTISDLLPAVLGCFERLGGAPERVVCDNDASIVRERRGGVAILHDEVAAFFGALAIRVVVLQPGRPQSKGQVERTNGYLDTSFLPLREFVDIDDMQTQHDTGLTTSPTVVTIVASARSSPTHGTWSGGSCARYPIRVRARIGLAKRASPATGSVTSVMSITRCRRALGVDACRSAARSPRSWCSTRVARSPAIAAASCRQTSCSHPSTLARCVWPVKLAAASTPPALRFPRPISRDTTIWRRPRRERGRLRRRVPVAGAQGPADPCRGLNACGKSPRRGLGLRGLPHRGALRRGRITRRSWRLQSREGRTLPTDEDAG